MIIGTICLLITGCNKGPYSAHVCGSVTLAEKPLTTGKVVFHPVNGGPLAYGSIDPKGRYVIHTAGSQGLIPGEYIATIVAFSKEPWLGITTEQVEQIRLAPRQYSDPKTSTARFRVAEGANECDIHMTVAKNVARN